MSYPSIHFQVQAFFVSFLVSLFLDVWWAYIIILRCGGKVLVIILRYVVFNLLRLGLLVLSCLLFEVQPILPFQNYHVLSSVCLSIS